MTWAVASPSAKYGINLGDVSHDPTPLSDIAVGPDDTHPVWHPDNPLLWFGVIAAGAVGLMGFSVHGRVGPARAGVDLGKS